MHPQAHLVHRERGDKVGRGGGDAARHRKWGQPPLLLPVKGKPPERHGRNRDVGVLGEQPRETQVSPRVREGAKLKFDGLWGLPKENPN